MVTTFKTQIFLKHMSQIEVKYKEHGIKSSGKLKLLFW